MAVFNISSLARGGKAKGSASVYNSLASQLSIMENNLAGAGDGKLAPGDYDVLVSMARSIATNPALTGTERNSVAVKISDYEKSKRTSAISNISDIERLNRETKDSFRKNAMMFANNPQIFLEANTDALKAKVTQLSSAIDGLSQSGADASAHINEFNLALSDYNDSAAALTSAKSYANQPQPQSDFVAYVTTNSKGEINDIKVGRIGSQQGYAETNGVYGGMQVHGKINRKEGSDNIFQLGNTRFRAPDISLPDPTNPLGTRANPLMAENTIQTQGSITTGKAGAYHVIDPLSLRPQGAIPTGGWAQGLDNVLYRRKDNGKYEKHVNVSPDDLGIQSNDILPIPSVLETSINSQVENTIDGSQPQLPQSFVGYPSAWTTGMQAIPPTPAQPIGPQQVPNTFGPTSRTQAPTERAPQGAKAVAQNLIQSTKGFLGSLFGG